MNRIDDPVHDQEAGARDAPVDPSRIDDVRIRAVRPVLSPAVLLGELPVTQAIETHVLQARAAVSAVVQGRDDRLVVVVGPCSIHDQEQALHYARHLLKAAQQHQGDLVVVMRVYFEKPRTTVGWKGFINDPDLDGSCHINKGLRLSRELLLEINRMGLAAGTEFLDLLTPQYLSDLIAWGAIGARTTESQSHRQLASGMSCAVGFKNGTDGGVQIAADALVAARSPHSFMGMTKMGAAAIFDTVGNPDGHVVLRGGRQPNWEAASVQAACAVLERAGLPQRVMIDCSHANSAKQPRRQIEVARDVARRISAGDRQVLGVMVESHLHEGRQDLDLQGPMTYGVSITDACLGWVDTEPLLAELASAVRQRRELRSAPA